MMEWWKITPNPNWRNYKYGIFPWVGYKTCKQTTCTMSTRRQKYADFTEPFTWNKTQHQKQALKRHSKSRLLVRGYPNYLFERIFMGFDFNGRKIALQEKNKVWLTTLPFVSQYNPSAISLKKILLSNWQIIGKYPKPQEIYKGLPIVSCKMGKSFLKGHAH